MKVCEANTWTPDDPMTKFWAVFEGDDVRHRLDCTKMERDGWYSLDSRTTDSVRVLAISGTTIGVKVEAVCETMSGGIMVVDVISGVVEVPQTMGFMGAPGFMCIPATASDGKARAMAFFHVLEVQPENGTAAQTVVAFHLSVQLESD